MRDLIREVEKNNLKNIRTHKMGYELTILEASQYSQENLIGKYLVIPMSLDTINKISVGLEEFGKFEDSIVAPFFFELEGDWSWNLYILFVLNEGDYEQLDLERKMLLEHGKRYGRKFVINRSKLSNYLPVAKLQDDIESKFKVNPYEDWFDKLDPFGLTFCLEGYSGAFINRYLNGDTIDKKDDGNRAEISTEDNDSDCSKSNQISIDSIYFGTKFRPHCWDEHKEIPFTQVNLIEGKNGSGKTSILEAIELAFTGQILRNKMSSGDISETWDGQLSYWDGLRKFVKKGLPSFSEQQAKETQYYQYRARDRVRTRRLSQNLHENHSST